MNEKIENLNTFNNIYIPNLSYIFYKLYIIILNFFTHTLLFQFLVNSEKNLKKIYPKTKYHLLNVIL